jgi:hypothetical protein
MSSIQPYSPTSISRSPYSRTGRELSRIVGGAELAVVRVAGRAAVESAKIEALQGIASQAMHGVALVSQLEQQLGQMVPIASSRLQALGDMHALASAEIVSSAPRRLA